MSKADVPAFEDLYRQHSTRLFNLAWRMCGTRADAEDLMQEIFLLAYRKLPEFRGDSTVGTWLYRLAMNRCLEHLKKPTDPSEGCDDHAGRRGDAGTEAGA